jgi:hypothetical protein
MELFRSLLDNPYASSNLEYILSISPKEVLDLIARNSEQSDFLSGLIPLESNKNFWVSFEGKNIFKLSQKWIAKGYSNSLEPVLVGWVTSRNGGSLVSVNFEIQRRSEN